MTSYHRLDHLAFGVLAFDRNLLSVYANPVAAAFLGLDGSGERHPLSLARCLELAGEPPGEIRRRIGRLRMGRAWQREHRRPDGRILQWASFPHEGGCLLLAADVSLPVALEGKAATASGFLVAGTASAPEWVWEMDRDLCFTCASSPFFAIPGFTMERTIGLKREDLALPSERRALAAQWHRHLDCLDRRLPFKDFCYTMWVRETDSLCTVRVSGLPVHDGSGLFLGYVGTGASLAREPSSHPGLLAVEAALGRPRPAERQVIGSQGAGNQGGVQPMTGNQATLDLNATFHSRDLQILKLASQGLRNWQIAENLHISDETVKWYLKRLYQKLGVGNRIEALAMARRAGLAL